MADPTLFQNGYIAFTTSTGGTAYTELLDVKAIQMPINMAELANSVMGDVAETFYPGLFQAPITVRCRQSFGAGSPDALGFARMSARTAFKVKIRAVDAAVSTTNPSYIFGKAYITAVTPITGDHGQLLENEIQLRLGSPTTAITRSTST